MDEQERKLAAIQAMSTAELIGAKGPEHVDDATSEEREQLVNYWFAVNAIEEGFEDALHNGDVERGRRVLSEWSERRTALAASLTPPQQANPRNPVAMVVGWHREMIRAHGNELDDLRGDNQ